MWTITATQDEASWLSDHIASVVANRRPTLPEHDQKIGRVEVHWHQVAPDRVYVAAHPGQGTLSDRLLAEHVVMGLLVPHGFKRAVYKEAASWGVSEPVQEKARRLVQSGSVHLDRNSQEAVVAHVDGDTEGTHQVEIRRQNPQEPTKVTGAFCDCTWGKFMNLPRTRQWKRFQKTPCAHIVAVSWLAQSVPTDESRAPGNQGDPGQMSLFDQSGGEAPSSMGLMRQMQQPPSGMGGGDMGQQMQMPLNSPGGAVPPPEDVLPQFPMDPSMQPQLPQVNPASVPGQKPGPTPTNPLQYPGGTFSSVMSAIFQPEQTVRARVPVGSQDAGPGQAGTQIGRSPEHGAGNPIMIPAGRRGRVRGVDPITGMVEVLFMDDVFDQNSFFEPYAATVWCWPSEIEPASGQPPEIRR